MRIHINVKYLKYSQSLMSFTIVLICALTHMPMIDNAPDSVKDTYLKMKSEQGVNAGQDWCKIAGIKLIHPI